MNNKDNMSPNGIVLLGDFSFGENSPNELINAINDVELRKQLQSNLEKKRLARVGRPRKDIKGIRQDDLFIRYTTLYRKEQVKKLKEIALRENLTMKELFESIFSQVISKYECANGVITINEQ